MAFNWLDRQGNVDMARIDGSDTLNYMLYVRGRGYIRVSSNYGASFSDRGTGNLYYYDCASSSTGIKMVACTESEIYTSTNYGSNWTLRFTPGVGTKISVDSSSTGVKLVAANYGGFLYTSIDSGANWVARTAVARDWGCISSSADGVKLVASASGYGVCTSTDSGANWVLRNSTYYFITLSSSSDGTKIIGWDGNSIYISTNSGSGWTKREPFLYAPIRRGYVSLDGTRFFCSTDTDLYTSTDNGANWSVVLNGASHAIVAASDGNTIYAAMTGTSSGKFGTYFEPSGSMFSFF